MALSIENSETEKLAREIAELTGENLEAAIGQALRERRDRLDPPPRSGRRPRTEAELLDFLETEIWPYFSNLGGPAITKEEKEEILGYGQIGA